MFEQTAKQTGLTELMTIGGTDNKSAFLVVALIIIFKKTTAPWLSPLYAILKGLVVGALSTWMEMRFPGIVLQAIALTLGGTMDHPRRLPLASPRWSGSEQR